MSDADPTPSSNATVTATPSSVTTTTTVKPGIKTSEGVLAYLSALMTGLFGAGVIPSTGTVALVATVAAIALTSAGYSVSRAMVKGAA